MPVDLQTLCNTEIKMIRHLFPASSTVLEIGGGNGYQAALLTGFGSKVTSIDISRGNRPAPTYYPVQEYNGSDLPFPDREFDVVFSSNVLEHVKNLPRLLQDMHRATTAGRLSIHIVPTPLMAALDQSRPLSLSDKVLGKQARTWPTRTTLRKQLYCTTRKVEVHSTSAVRWSTRRIHQCADRALLVQRTLLVTQLPPEWLPN